MGDHRANIKIEMEFHGIKDKIDMWINYFPGECEGVDNRIIEFCRNIYNAGMEKYNAETKNYIDEARAKEIEEMEKAELERLKKKYETR